MHPQPPNRTDIFPAEIVQPGLEHEVPVAGGLEHEEGGLLEVDVAVSGVEQGGGEDDGQVLLRVVVVARRAVEGGVKADGAGGEEVFVDF